MYRYDVTVIVANFNDAEKVSLQLSQICDSSMVIVAHHRTITKNNEYESRIKKLSHQVVIRDTIDVSASDEKYYRICSNQMCFKSKLVVFSPKAIEKIMDRSEYDFSVSHEPLSIMDSYCIISEHEFYHLKDKVIGFNSHSQYNRIEDLMNLIRRDDII